MLHCIHYTLVYKSQVISDFTYILNKTELRNKQLEELILANYRSVSKIPVTAVQVDRVKIYQEKNNG